MDVSDGSLKRRISWVMADGAKSTPVAGVGRGFGDMMESDDLEKEVSQRDAEDGAGGDLYRFVTDALLQVREFGLFEIELRDESVDIDRMLAHVDAETEGVHHDEDHETECQAENRRVPAVPEADGRSE